MPSRRLRRTTSRFALRPRLLSSLGSVVIGAEADIQWADTDDGESAVFIPAPGFTGTFVPGRFENSQDWFGTVRARAGVAFGQALIYATGGLAYSDDNTGWTAGGGVEWALPVSFFGSSAITFGVEALYLSFDEDDDNNRSIGTFDPVGGPPVQVFGPAGGDDNADFWVARQAELQVRHLLGAAAATDKGPGKPGPFVC